jgi:hypothetical protein
MPGITNQYRPHPVGRKLKEHRANPKEQGLVSMNHVPVSSAENKWEKYRPS